MWLSIILWLTMIAFIPYAIIILMYRKWFLQLKEFVLPQIFQPHIKFSIIIPARNEEKNIAACLQSIFKQKYSADLYEVIVVDDHSSDNTANIIKKLQSLHHNLTLISLADELKGEKLNSYKKKAIDIAIQQSTGEWIITTDADCFVTDQWLLFYAAMIQQKNPVFIAAPVKMLDNNDYLSALQSLDFMVLQGITAASVSAGFHSMCNGANLAYKKGVFFEVNGFESINHIASGDDMLLMNKMKQLYPQQIGALFAKEAIVSTLPMPDWKSFFNQRIRWASKADHYNDKSIFWVLVVVYFYNLFLLLLLFYSLFNLIAFQYWCIFLLLKIVVELRFAFPVAKFFDIRLKWWHILLEPLHIIYNVAAGWLGKFGTYQWKERKVK